MKWHRRNSLLLLILCLVVGNVKAQSYMEMRNNVGDIPFHADTDNPSFELIDENNILPYNTICGFLIEGERYRVLDYYNKNFKAEYSIGTSGYITIRFIVNHKGNTDRFRVFEMDNKYNPIKFPPHITDSLLELTKRLDGWITYLDHKLARYNCMEQEIDGKKKYAYDYYQYILFKLKDGKIETILP